MNTKPRFTSLWAVGALAVALAAGAPAFAQSHGGGGHGGGGGGGGHSGGSSGGHSSGGHYSGGHGFAGGHAYYGGHSYSGGGYAPRANYAYRGGYSGARSYAGVHSYAGTHSYAGSAVRGAGVSSYHNVTGHVGGFTRPGYGGQVSYGPGWGHAGFGYNRPYWGGGYWRGGWWPHAYYGWDYPWFLPILPAIYATYWWAGVPYYYANDVYYTWNPGYNGYVVTDPPPTEDSTAAPQDGGDNGDDSGAASGTNDVYVYPKNGQSDEQTQTDRYECHKWAVAQSGFDPTRGSQYGGRTADYRRAMSACLDGRGYSAK